MEFRSWRVLLVVFGDVVFVGCPDNSTSTSQMTGGSTGQSSPVSLPDVFITNNLDLGDEIHWVSLEGEHLAWTPNLLLYRDEHGSYQTATLDVSQSMVIHDLSEGEWTIKIKHGVSPSDLETYTCDPVVTRSGADNLISLEDTGVDASREPFAIAEQVDKGHPKPSVDYDFEYDDLAGEELN